MRCTDLAPGRSASGISGAGAGDGRCDSFAAGAFLGTTTLRLGGHYLAMVTISFQQIVTLVMVNWIPVTHGPDGIGNIQRPAMFASSHAFLGLCVLATACVGYVVWRLPHTPLGRSMRAVRDNELAAGVAGINVFRVKVAAFALSAALGGIGGGFFAGGFGGCQPRISSASPSRLCSASR